MADREQGPREHGSGHRVQKIRLVLGWIAPRNRRPLAVRRGRLGIMTGREQVGAEAQRVLEADAELDLAVAGDVGIRRAARCAARRGNAGTRARGTPPRTHGMQRQARSSQTRARILEVGGRRAVGVFVLVPVAHEERMHVVTGVACSSTAETAESTPPESARTTRGRSCREL